MSPEDWYAIKQKKNNKNINIRRLQYMYLDSAFKKMNNFSLNIWSPLTPAEQKKVILAQGQKYEAPNKIWTNNGLLINFANHYIMRDPNNCKGFVLKKKKSLIDVRLFVQFQ